VQFQLKVGMRWSFGGWFPLVQVQVQWWLIFGLGRDSRLQCLRKGEPATALQRLQAGRLTVWWCSVKALSSAGRRVEWTGFVQNGCTRWRDSGQV
jgi:hypothetical protein